PRDGHPMSDITGRQPTTIDTETSIKGCIEALRHWALCEGLSGTTGSELFEAFCRRLVGNGLPLWRAFAGMRTLHPQWGGYTYTWWRDRNVIQPERRQRGDAYEQELQHSPFAYLLDTAGNSSKGRQEVARLRRRLTDISAKRDFAILEE